MMEVIDGTVPESEALAAYQVPNLPDEFQVDFLEGMDLEQLEDGIRQIQVTTDLLALVQGLAIVKVEREGLWMQAGYPNLRAYRIAQLERLDMPKQTLSRRRAVGEAYLSHRKVIGKTSLVGNVEKLRFLGEALERYDKKDVMAHFRKDSLRAFAEWAKPAALPEPDAPDVDFVVRGDAVFLDGSECLTFAEGLPAAERSFLEKLLHEGYKARQGGRLPHVVSVYDRGEAMAVDRFLKKHRAER